MENNESIRKIYINKGWKENLGRVIEDIYGGLLGKNVNVILILVF